MLDSYFFVVTFGAWLVFVVLAILNAAFRNKVYKPVVGDLAAHQISTIVFVSLIFVVTYLILQVSDLQLTDFSALVMGGIWLVSTTLFEFVAGHYVFKNSWKRHIKKVQVLKPYEGSITGIPISNSISKS